MSCKTCQNFPHPPSRFEELATSVERHGPLYRCKDCGTLFELTAEDHSVRFTPPDDLWRHYPQAHSAIMEYTKRLRWLTPPHLQPALAQMSDVQLRLFACDCAEHVLPYFERLMPDDHRPREAIQAARRFAKGEVDATALSAAAGQAEGAAWDAGEVAEAGCAEDTQALPADAAAASAAAAAEACCATTALEAAEATARCAMEVALITALGSQRADRVWAWQWHFATYAPKNLADPAILASKVGQELLEQYRQAEKQVHDWLTARAAAYLDRTRS